MELINHCETCKKTFMGYSVYLPKKKLHFCNWECYKVYEDKYKLTLNQELAKLHWRRNKMSGRKVDLTDNKTGNKISVYMGDNDTFIVTDAGIKGEKK